MSIKPMVDEVDVIAELKKTPETIKEYLWRPIQEAQLQKKSTTQLDTTEINKVYETLNRHLGEKTGVHIAFPSFDVYLDYGRQ